MNIKSPSNDLPTIFWLVAGMSNFNPAPGPAFQFAKQVQIDSNPVHQAANKPADAMPMVGASDVPVGLSGVVAALASSSQARRDGHAFLSSVASLRSALGTGYIGGLLAARKQKEGEEAIAAAVPAAPAVAAEPAELPADRILVNNIPPFLAFSSLRDALVLASMPQPEALLDNLTALPAPAQPASAAAQSLPQIVSLSVCSIMKYLGKVAQTRPDDCTEPAVLLSKLLGDLRFQVCSCLFRACPKYPFANREYACTGHAIRRQCYSVSHP